jgi:hypothetical protein
MNENYIIILTLIVGFIITKVLKFKNKIKKDNKNLDAVSMKEKFWILANGLKEHCFESSGNIKTGEGLYRNTLTISGNNSPHLIKLQYFRNKLTIIWNYNGNVITKLGIDNPYEDLTEEKQYEVIKLVIKTFNEDLQQKK